MARVDYTSITIGVFFTAFYVVASEMTVTLDGPTEPVKQGQSFELVCQAGNGFQSGMIIRLFKKVDGEEKEFATNSFVRPEFRPDNMERYKANFASTTGGASVTITVSNAQNGDGGEYSCMILNGPRTTWTTVNVVVPATLVMKYFDSEEKKFKPLAATATKITLQDYVDGGFLCVSKGSNVEPTIRAYIGGTEVKGQGTESQQDPDQVSLGDSLIVATTYRRELRYESDEWPPEDYEGKVIRCTVQVEGYEPVERTATIEVQYPPVFTCDKKQGARVGQPVEITCQVDMKPIHTYVTWFWGPHDARTYLDNGKNISQTFKATQGEVSGNTYTFSLSITPVKEEYLTTYHLEVSNDVGEARNQAIELVQQKEDPPKQDKPVVIEIKEPKPGKSQDSNGASHASLLAYTLTTIVAMVTAAILNH